MKDKLEIFPIIVHSGGEERFIHLLGFSNQEDAQAFSKARLFPSNPKVERQWRTPPPDKPGVWASKRKDMCNDAVYWELVYFRPDHPAFQDPVGWTWTPNLSWAFIVEMPGNLIEDDDLLEAKRKIEYLESEVASLEFELAQMNGYVP
ncbi:MAG: hypothetical protein JWM68_2509 [Verrucomicrobiales bacterium]|nr:hypothetical protein [Verrucomicrobiales bacterium]